MTPFVIFALVLTFAYVVYFTVMITIDLHAKKDEKKVEEENIDVSEFAVEAPVVVEESDDPNGGTMTDTVRKFGNYTVKIEKKSMMTDFE